MSMSMPQPLDQQQPPPPPIMPIIPQHSTHGSIGPVIAVLIVIMVLGMAAAMIGRLCSRRTIMGYGQYDMERWAEVKCSSCIDGRIFVPQPPPTTSEPSNVSNVSSPSVPEPMPVQTQSEPREE